MSALRILFVVDALVHVCVCVCLCVFRDPGIREFGNLGLISGIQGVREFGISGIQEFRKSGIREFRNSGIQEFRNSEIQEVRNPGIQEFRNAFQIIQILTKNLSKIIQTSIKVD